MSNNTSQIEIYSHSFSSSLEEALEFAPSILGETVFVFLTTPRSWTAHWWSNDLLEATPFSNAVFEARWFNESGEIRWVRQGSGGKAVVITSKYIEDLPPVAEKYRISSSTQLRKFRVVNRSYRCWGKITSFDADARVAFLSESRIGVLSMPVEGSAKEGDQVYIHARELVGLVSHGNMRVIDEILTSVSVRPPKKNMEIFDAN